MPKLLSVFAEFEHEILRECIRAGIVEARPKTIGLGDSVAARDKKRENVMILSRLLKTTVAPLTWVGLDNVRCLNRLHCWQFVLSRSANPDERLRIVLGE
jgi:hypothetical protein